MSGVAIAIVCAGLSPALFFVWAAIHEFSHLLMAKALVGSRLISLKLWPHWFKGTFYFASIRHDFERSPTAEQEAAIHLAPRIPGVAAAAALPFTAFLPSPWIWFVGLAVGAALIDIAVGSIGWSDRSDAKRAAAALRFSVWWVRIIGWLIVLTSAGAWTAVAFKTIVTLNRL